MSILINNDYNEYSRYNISNSIDLINNKLTLSFLLAGATYGNVQRDIDRFEAMGNYTFVKATEDIVNGRSYINIYAYEDEGITLKIGSIPAQEIEEGVTFRDAFKELFLNSDYKVGDSIILDDIVDELSISDIEWNNQARLIRMNIVVNINNLHLNEEIVEEIEEVAAPALIPVETTLTDIDTINVLKTLTLSYFLEQGLYKYTANKLNELQEA